MKFDFVILISLLLVVSFLTGFAIRKQPISSKSSLQYWRLSIFLILTYSLIEGLRYLRGVDYMEYVYVYWGLSDRPEFMFNLLINFLKSLLGDHFYISFVVYSFIWIVCLLIFLREHKTYLVLLLPLMIISNWYYSENFIRQYLAFSFNLISINYILLGKWKKFIVASAIAVFLHTIAVAYIVLIIVNCFYKKKYPIIVTITLYLFSFTMSSNADFFGSTSRYFDSYLSSELSESRYENYAENSDRWFGEDALNEERYEKSILSQTGMVVFDLLLILYGYMVLNNKKEPYWIGVYNLFVYGAVFFQLFMNIEILRRFTFCFYALWPMIFVLIYKRRSSIPKSLLPNIGISYMVVYIISYQIIKMIYLSTGGQLFIWDMGTGLERDLL